LFRYPVDPIADEVPDYGKIIKNPQDLGTIRRKLEARSYKSAEDWRRDVGLVWSNAERYNGRDSPVGMVSRYMAAKFSKMVKHLRRLTHKEWIEVVSGLFEKLNGQVQGAPGFLKAYFEEREFGGPLTHEEMQRLCTAASGLTDRSDVLQMIQLLTLFGVKLDLKEKENFIGVRNLPPGAIRALISFTRDRYRAMRIPYPC
jgi:hypothetical protein